MKKFFTCLVVIFLISGISIFGISCKKNGDSASSSISEISKESSSSEISNDGKTEESKTSTEPVTLNILLMSQSGYSEEDSRKISEEFTSKNPNIKINPTFIAYESLHDKIITSFAGGGDAYDVVLVDCVWTAELVSAGYLMDISGKITDEMKEDIWPELFKAGLYNDKYFAMPWLNDIPYFYYNEKILKDAGFSAPPKTWTELIEQAKAIKQKGLVEYPYIDAWPQTEELVVQYTLYNSALGGNYFDKDMNVILNKPEGKGVDSLNFMLNGLKEKVINPSSMEMHYDDVRKVLSQGNAAFALGWTYMWGMLNDPNESKVVGDMKIALIPGQETTSVTVNGGMALGISSKTKYPDEAFKYIEYMSSKDVQRRFSQNSLPIWISLYDDPEVKETQPDLVNISKEQYKYIVNRPIVPWYAEFSRSIQLEIQNALVGSKTAEQAVNDISQKANELKSK